MSLLYLHQLCQVVHEKISAIAQRFICNILKCSDVASVLGGPTLKSFIAFVIGYTGFPHLVLVAALDLLLRLKLVRKTFTAKTGHSLFLAAFMIASEEWTGVVGTVLPISTWCEAAQMTFTEDKIVRAEKYLRHALKGKVGIPNEDVLHGLEAQIGRAHV